MESSVQHLADHLDITKPIWVIFSQNTSISIHENARESVVCKMSAVCSGLNALSEYIGCT